MTTCDLRRWTAADQRLVEADRKQPGNGRTRRYDGLADRGRATLDAEARRMEQTARVGTGRARFDPRPRLA